MSWWRLVRRRFAHEWKQSMILIVCLTIAMALPLTSRGVVSQYETDLRSRAATTPLVAGNHGNRFDLALTALYFRNRDLESTKYRLVEELDETNQGQPIPLHVRFTAADQYPIVGTELDYFLRRGLTPSVGTLPTLLGQAVIGANVAESLNLTAGDKLFSDQRELYDIAKPPAVRMFISGVLARSDSPDDDAVFVDLKTAWLIEGLTHGHNDPATELSPDLIMGETEERIVVSPAMVEFNEVTPENISTFHFHGDIGDYPVTAVLFFPDDQKADTITRSRTDHADDTQMIRPARVVDELISYVFRIQSLFDGLAVLLGVSTLALTTLVIAMSIRMRAKERRTLHAIGCSPSMVVRLHIAEVAVLVTLAVIAAIAVSTAATAVLSNVLVRLIG